jgi:DNA polymerase V
MERYIGVIDCNNFFVSCERLFRPDLKTRPVVVLSSNDGCVVARSNEVKALGIPMGVPYFKVKGELAAANTAIFSSNFALYRDISRRVMQVLRQELPEVEPYSVDEAFFAVPAREVEELEAIAQRVKAAVGQWVGVPVSIGIARTKTIAKYAVEVEKRGSGVCVLIGDAWRERTPTIPVGEVWGIGRNLSARFQSHGVATVADLLAADPSRIDRLFGVVGLRTQAELQEVVAYPVGGSAALPKSIMSTRSFKRATHDRAVVEDALAYHVGQVAAELREVGLAAGYLQVIARPSRHGDWVLATGSAERLLPEPSSDTRVLLGQAIELLGTFFDPRVPYQKAGVVVGALRDASQAQETLFPSKRAAQEDLLLMRTIDSLNDRLGKGTVVIGSRGKQAVWEAHHERLSPHYTTHWGHLASVKA